MGGLDKFPDTFFLFKAVNELHFNTKQPLCIPAYLSSGLLFLNPSQ